MQKPGGRGGTALGERLDLLMRENRRGIRDRRLVAQELWHMRHKKGAQAGNHHGGGVLTAHRQDVLARDLGLDVAAAQQGVQRLLEIVWRAFFDHQHR